MQLTDLQGGLYVYIVFLGKILNRTVLWGNEMCPDVRIEFTEHITDIYMIHMYMYVHVHTGVMIHIYSIIS